MTRVTVDGLALNDPRFVRFAELSGYADSDHAIGKMIRVWLACTTAGTDTPATWLVESILGVNSAQRLVESDLAIWHKSGRDFIYIRGARGRIEWYQRLRNSASAGGKARAANTSRVAGRFASHEGGGATSALTLTHTLTRSKTPIVPTGDGLPVNSGKRGRPKKPKPSDATEQELASVQAVLGKLSARNGIRYSGSAEHTRLIVAQLRQGVTELDLRKVIAYCAEKAFPDSKPELRMYLRPETLFGPKTIARYLDAARAYYETMPEGGTSK